MLFYKIHEKWCQILFEYLIFLHSPSSLLVSRSSISGSTSSPDLPFLPSLVPLLESLTFSLPSLLFSLCLSLSFFSVEWCLFTCFSFLSLTDGTSFAGSLTFVSTFSNSFVFCWSATVRYRKNMKHEWNYKESRKIFNYHHKSLIKWMLLYDSKCKHTALKKKICFNKSKKKLKIDITGIVICIKLIWITCPKILQLFQQAV